MAPPVVTVTGAKELRRALKAAGADLKQLTAAHKRAASIAATAAAASAPRRTGALAASVRPGATQTKGSIRAGSARVPYANPIHWGWARRGIAPNPWVTIAAQRTEPQWANVYRQEIDRLLEKVAHG